MSFINPEDLVYLKFEPFKGIDTLMMFNTVEERLIAIEFCHETETDVLIGLWDGDEYIGKLKVDKKNINDQSFETMTASIWNEVCYVESALAMLDQKRINEAARYQSPLGMIAEVSASMFAKIAARIYLERTRAEGIEVPQIGQLDNSYRVPEELVPTYTRIRLGTMYWFDICPEAAEEVHRDYCRVAVAAALRDLSGQGVRIQDLPRKQFRQILNKHVFRNGDFNGFVEAIDLCSAILARTTLELLNFENLSIRAMEKMLLLRKKPSRAKQPRPPLLTFEREAILPFGEVEETIRMSWQCPGTSDLEIIHEGTVSAEIVQSMDELIEDIGLAIKWWREKENQLKEARERIPNDPQEAFSYMRSVFYERRFFRRYMRSRYGIDMARRRMLRKATRPKTAEDTARRAFYYGNATALETAASAAVFTFDWFKTELTEMVENGQELPDEVLNIAVKQAAKAALGAMEALPHFHCAIMERASQPAIREAELYVLSGFAGTHISLKRFPRLRKAVTREQMLKLLPEAVSRVMNERRLGDPLVRGRNSLRNRVARFLEKQSEQAPQREPLYFTDNIEAVSTEIAMGEPFSTERFTLIDEAEAKLAEKVSQSPLSPRERSVLELKLKGHSQKEIASMLKISVGAVKKLKARAYTKLRA